jgi:hypothetical protein
VLLRTHGEEIPQNIFGPAGNYTRPLGAGAGARGTGSSHPQARREEREGREGRDGRDVAKAQKRRPSQLAVDFAKDVGVVGAKLLRRLSSRAEINGGKKSYSERGGRRLPALGEEDNSSVGNGDFKTELTMRSKIMSYKPSSSPRNSSSPRTVSGRSTEEKKGSQLCAAAHNADPSSST